MVSTVKSQPNHYEVLGLTPEASDEDIARAFAREISPYRPRPVGGVAQLGLAYETLRDPAKRRAYDSSLGLRPEPEPAPIQWPRDGWPFVASARVGSADLPAIDSLQRPTRPASPEPRQEAPVEPRPEPFVAASERKTVEAEAPAMKATAPRPHPEPLRRPEPLPEPRLTSEAGGDRTFRIPAELRNVEDGSIEWKRPALTVGALLLAVGFFGAWMGLEAGNDVEEQPERSVTFPVPQARAMRPPVTDSPPATVSRPAAEPSVAEARPEPRTRAEESTARIASAEPPPQPTTLREEQQAELAQAEPSRIEDIAAGLAVEEAPAVEAAQAKLPLPNAVVARTIRRIGYSCGDVASTAAVDGAGPGVFKVTCTSGDSYRAAPVGGRYHFRRWGRD